MPLASSRQQEPRGRSCWPSLGDVGHFLGCTIQGLAAGVGAPSPRRVDSWLFSSVHWVDEGLEVAMALAET